MDPRPAWDPVRVWCVQLAVLAAVGVGAFGAARSLGRRWRPRPAPPAIAPRPLEVDLASLDFGEVLESGQFHHELRVRNVSSGPLTVRWENSCDSAGVEPEALRLAPGEAGRVTARLDLLRDQLHYPGQPTRPYRARLRAVYGGRPREQLLIELTGTVRATLNLRSPRLHLKEDLVEGEDGAEEAVRAKPAVAPAWLAVKELPPYFEARVEPGEQEYTLYVRPKAGLPRGHFLKTIVLQMADAKGVPLPDQFLAVMGTVTGRFVSSPAETDLGVRTVGTVAEETVRVRSRRAERFTVVRVTAGSRDTVAETLPGAVGEAAYRVRQRVAEAGRQRATVSFVVRDARGREHTVTHAVTYYGTEVR